MLVNEKKVSIFIDTNIFQTLWTARNNKNVFLDKIEAPLDYYKLIEFMNFRKRYEQTRNWLHL